MLQKKAPCGPRWRPPETDAAHVLYTGNWGFLLPGAFLRLLPEDGRAFFAPPGFSWLVTRSSKLNRGRETHQLFLEGGEARAVARPASIWDELERKLEPRASLEGR